MGLLILFVPADHEDLALGSPAIEALARLGVTSVSLARDEETAAVILEGWAFNAARPDAALSALGAAWREARTLQPVMQMAVSAAGNDGGFDR
jgi:hypothetical protein